MMKKYILCFFAALSLMLLCGCGQKEVHYITKTVEVEKIVEVPVEVEKIVEVEVPYETSRTLYVPGSYAFSHRAEAEASGAVIPADFVATFEDGTEVVLFYPNSLSYFRSHPDKEKSHIISNIYLNESTNDKNLLIASCKKVTLYGSYDEYLLIKWNGRYGWIKDTGLSTYGDISGTYYRLPESK